MKPGIHGARTHWIRGFMAFQSARRTWTVMLMVPVTFTPVPADKHSDGLVAATPIRRGSGSISRLMRAHAWWPVPIGQGKFARGEHVDVQLIPGRPP
jgi:hypothetical protein